MIGKTISHYKIIETLGQGGMGVVYKAEDTKLKRTVALKFLPQELTRDAEAKERFIREARAASTLEHNNICNIHEIDETADGQLFIVMAFYEGQTLKQKIDQGLLGIDEAIDIAQQIARGLHKAHQQNIIHRDIKPANILLDTDGVVKILDFGLAKLAGQAQLTRDNSTLGTVAYMSPEQISGSEVDQRSDIWSLGVVLYEMVTGQLPFKGEYEQAIMYSILNEQPKPPTAVRSCLPIELERIILKALAQNSDERYQHMDEIITELKAIQKSGTSVPSRQKEKEKPRSFLKTGTASLLILLIIAAGFILGKYVFFKPAVGSAPLPIAVINFENITGEAQYDYLRTAIPNLLISKLEQSHFLRVTTWERMHDLLQQMGKPKVETIDKNLGFELCRRDSVNFIVLGSFTKAGNVFATDVKVLDVQSKRLLKSASARGEGAGSILKSQIDQLSEQIIRGIGIFPKKEKLEPQISVAEITTNSLKAYRYYLKATSAF